MKHLLPLLAALALPLLLSACASGGPGSGNLVWVEGDADYIVGGQPGQPPAAYYPGARPATPVGNFRPTPLPPRNERANPSNFVGPASGNGPTVSGTDLPPIYFGLDRAEIPSQELPKLASAITSIANATDPMIVAGFTDDRGTEEYNRALGERRANIVRDFLIQNGIPAARLQTISYGEEMPAVPGSGESAWSRNRRVEMSIIR